MEVMKLELNGRIKLEVDIESFVDPPMNQFEWYIFHGSAKSVEAANKTGRLVSLVEGPKLDMSIEQIIREKKFDIRPGEIYTIFFVGGREDQILAEDQFLIQIEYQPADQLPMKVNLFKPKVSEKKPLLKRVANKLSFWKEEKPKPILPPREKWTSVGAVNYKNEDTLIKTAEGITQKYDDAKFGARIADKRTAEYYTILDALNIIEINNGAMGRGLELLRIESEKALKAANLNDELNQLKRELAEFNSKDKEEFTEFGRLVESENINSRDEKAVKEFVKTNREFNILVNGLRKKLLNIFSDYRKIREEYCKISAK